MKGWLSKQAPSISSEAQACLASPLSPGGSNQQTSEFLGAQAHPSEPALRLPVGVSPGPFSAAVPQISFPFFC